ncbi:MarR family winged helix-turn-helix transcriptional regulator [Streptomyces sp. LZ34]
MAEQDPQGGAERAELRRLLKETEGTCFAAAARRAARLLTAAYDRALAPSGLRIGQFSLLHSVALHGPLPLAQLAEHIGMDRTTLTRNLKPMVREGLLAVTPGAQDHRVRAVAVTNHGAERLLQALPLWEGAQADVAADFGVDRAARLRSELKAVARTGPAAADTGAAPA